MDLKDDEWQRAGYIYYPNAKAPAPILIVDNWGDEKPKDSDDDYIHNIDFHLNYIKVLHFQDNF